MHRFEWNALRPGDQVVVHDDGDRSLSLHDGVVVTTRVATDGDDDVAIRFGGPGGPSAIVWPRRLAVHLTPIDPAEWCWRCADTNGPSRVGSVTITAGAP